MMGVLVAAVASVSVFGAAALRAGQATQGGRGSGAGEPGYVWPTPTDADLRLVQGAIDIHTHLDPDSAGPHSAQQARSIDVIDAAKRAKAIGMRGFVIKQHYDQSAQLAYVVRKEVPGLEVFGLVGQNLAIGGVNPAAVYHMAEVKGGWGRFVMMPTWDGENNVKRGNEPGRPFVSVVKNGQVTPEVQAVISIVASTKTRDSNGDLVLATGHSSADEALMILREARRQGVAHMVVTHAIGNPVFMTLQQMQEAVGLGAFIEFVAQYAMGPKPAFTLAAYADAMRKVGVDNVIISTDFGQQGRIIPTDGLAVFAGLMKKEGFTDRELHRMMAENPARLMGLPPAPAPSASAGQR
jgi:hypothetical protein